MKSWAGLFLKLISVGSKLLLLVFILRKLAEGALSEYYFYVTVAIVVARVISIGSEEQIALQRLPDRTKFFYPMVWWWGLSTAILLLISFFFHGFSWIALAAAISFSAIVAGFVRVESPGSYELVINIPYAMVLLLCFLLGVESAQSLLIYLAVSFFFVSFVVFSIYKPDLLMVGFSLSPFKPLSLLFFAFSQWVGRVLTSSLLVLNLRYALLVYLFCHSSSNDMLALSLAVGEVVWQLGMVFVNRKFSELVRSERAVRWDADVLKMVVPFVVYCVLALAFSILGIFLVKLLNWIPDSSISSNYLMGGIIFGCSVCMLSYLRVLYVASGLDGVRRKGFNFLVLQITMISLGGCIAVFLPEHAFWASLYFGAAVNFVCVLLWMRVFKNLSVLGVSRFT